MKKVITYVLCFILASCTNYLENKLNNSDPRENNVWKKNSILVLIDSAFYSDYVPELKNSSQLAFGRFLEKNPNTKSEVSFEIITDDYKSELLDIAMRKKYITHIIAFTDKDKIANIKFLFKNTEVTAIDQFTDLFTYHTNNNNLNEVLSKIISVIYDKKKIIFIGYKNDKMHDYLYKALIKTLPNQDVMIDFIEFSNEKAESMRSSIAENGIDTIIFNISLDDVLKFDIETWFSRTVILCHKETNIFSKMPNISDLYFIFLDFEKFKHFANDYTGLFKSEIPSVNGYIVFNFVQDKLSGDCSNFLKNMNFELYKKNLDKIVKCE